MFFLLQKLAVRATTARARGVRARPARHSSRARRTTARERPSRASRTPAARPRFPAARVLAASLGDRPPERSHPTRLRTRRGSEKARPWRRPPCRRSWCVSTPRTRPRLSCSPRPASRARARPRRAARPPPDRVAERVSNARGLSARRGARRAERRFFVTNAESALRRAGASRRASVFRHASRRDRDPRSIRHTRRDTRGHRLTSTTSVAPPPTRDARE